MDKRRLEKMSSYLSRESGLLLKLSTTSIALKTVIAKLHSHHISLIEEQRKDKEYYESYLAAYLECNEEEGFAESFSDVSYEVDKLMAESYKDTGDGE